jgi:SPP1 family predicted phage head-tail adaptor
MGGVSLNIGALGKRITLQYPVETTDGMGGFSTVWTDDCTIFAAIWPVSANEAVAANATSMVISHKIRIRYHSTAKASWRVKFGSRYFTIISIVNPNEGNRQQDLLCKEAAS